jgi:uncharacterized membrane protein YkgB
MAMMTGTKLTTLAKRAQMLADALLMKAALIAAPALRISLGVILLWIGLLKFADPTPVVGLIQASPFHALGNAGFVHFLGVLEVIAAALLLTNRAVRYVGLATVLLFASTLTIFLTTPAVVYGMAGFPHLSLAGQFLLKDLVLAAASITVAVQAASAQRKAAR